MINQDWTDFSTPITTWPKNTTTYRPNTHTHMYTLVFDNKGRWPCNCIELVGLYTNM